MKNEMDEYLTRARALHHQIVVLDSHCDTTQKLMKPDWDFSKRQTSGHVDLPRLQEGGVSGVWLAVYAAGPFDSGGAADVARRQVQRIKETCERFSSSLTLARAAEDARRAKSEGRIALFIGIEGGALIDDSLDVLRELNTLGASYLTLTHATHTNWADSAGIHADLIPRHGGLTDFGRDVIRELNRLGMMVDVSHVSDGTFWQVIEISSAPVMASHSSCRAISPHRRNLSDEMIRAIAKTGGTIQINFSAAFIDPKFPPIDSETFKSWRGGPTNAPEHIRRHQTPLSCLADHVDHAMRLVGPAHVGLGSDFDGVAVLPRGMEDCSKLPYLTAELMRRGHDEEVLAKMLGENILRVLEKCQLLASERKVASI